MFLPGWFTLSLTLYMTVYGLETSGYDSHEVTCSQALSECTMRDGMFLPVPESTVDVQNLKSHFQLCCKNRTTCTLCLVIEAELNIHPDKDVEDEGHSGSDEEDYKEEARNPKASVTVCYSTAVTMPTCKKVEFTVNHTALTQRNQAKISIIIITPGGFPFSSQMFVYPSKQTTLRSKVIAPSQNEVCSLELQQRVPKCQVPRVSTVTNQEMNQVELQFEGRNKTPPSICVQHEENGSCRSWNRSTIPLYSVTPCTCLQVWDEDDQRSTRSQHCPFNTTNVLPVLQKNIWDNVSVTVRPSKMSSDGMMLLWNVSAPCRLEGEVWPCHNEISCREINSFRQQLANGKWSQNSKGHWVKKGQFEDIDLQLSPCVMVKVKGMRHELGPFCPDNTGRWRWSLLVVVVMLLVCLTALMFYFLRDFVKKWVWSYRHGGFVRIGSKGHVVLLSPPDMDDDVSESVCQLGSLLLKQGFGVSVDQWCRKEQCTMGPLPWLHSQMLKLNSLGGRVLLIVTSKSLEKAEEWSHWSKDVIKNKEEDKDVPQTCSPYSDVFTASLFLILTAQQQGGAAERFLLVTFDSKSTWSHGGDRTLPELFRGLPLFQLPSQTQSLLTELTVAETERGSGGKTWTGWTWVLLKRMENID